MKGNGSRVSFAMSEVVGGRGRRGDTDVDGGGDAEWLEEDRMGVLRERIEDVERGRRSFAL